MWFSKKRAAPAPGTTPDPHRRFFFIHIMKTGGTTMLYQMHRHYRSDEVFPNYELDIENQPFLGHLRIDYLLNLPKERRQAIRVYTGHYPYITCDLLGLDFIKFSVLRDPVERTVSFLQQLKRNGPRHESSTLEQIYDSPHVPRNLVANHQTTVFSTRVTDDPADYLFAQPVIDAERLAAAKANLLQLDVLGVHERYDEFERMLEDRFGWDLNRNMRANKTRGVDDASLDLRRRIAADNRFDLELYEYARDLVRQRSEADRERRDTGA